MISVIVPVYNVEKYLNKCIKSILNQSYTEYEIILVDDGSTDSSGEICDKYSFNSKVKVIHKENGGLSDARNVGIDLAKGDFITFVDSDDWVDSDYLKILINTQILFNSDIVISGLIDYFGNENIKPEYSNFSINLSKEECFKKILLQDDIDVNATAKLYRKSLFSKIRYVKGQLYEDINIIDKIIENADNITYTKYKGYFYLQRQGSIMYGNFTKERLSLLEATERLIKLMEMKYPNNVPYAIRRYVYCNFHLLGRSILDDSNLEYSVIFRNNIIKYTKIILFTKLYSKKEKLALISLFLGLNTYGKIWDFYKKRNRSF